MFRQSSGDLRRHCSSNFTCFVPKPSVPLQWNPRKLPNFNILWNSLPPVPRRAYFCLGCPMHWRGFKLSPPTIQRSQHLEKKIQKIPPRRLIFPNGIASQHLFISAVASPFQQAFPFFCHRRCIGILLVKLLAVVAPSLSHVHFASGGFPPSSPLHRMSFRLSFSTY